ncbi:hypothetical protein SAMN05216297_10188 [Flavobacterium phragmitis]|uniref:Uncharacterized protein n=1 Tax=Flavobacterium phragmitis TaxID=739143 RepID=A0A1I1JY40_9FLAO|nr:hypothetical protein SAMN05216297_10188 [Flavobacterium phragmitis]
MAGSGNEKSKNSNQIRISYPILIIAIIISFESMFLPKSKLKNSQKPYSVSFTT